MFDNVASVEREDPFVLAAALADLGLEQISALPMNQAEAVVVATQRIVNAVTARQSAALDTHAARRGALAAQASRGPRRRSPAPARQLRTRQRGSPRSSAPRGAPDHERSTVRRPPTRQCAARDLRPAVERRPRALPVGRGRAGVQGAVVGAPRGVRARLHRRDVADVPCSRLRTMARRAAAETDLAAVRDAARKAADQRSIRVSPGEVNGMSTWTISLPVATSTRLWSAVDGLANEYLRAARGSRPTKPGSTPSSTSPPPMPRSAPPSSWSRRSARGRPAGRTSVRSTCVTSPARPARGLRRPAAARRVRRPRR